jgi:hypothetical protein
MGTTVSRDDPPYGRYAFWNPYNLSLFLGGIAFGFLSGHTWLVVVTCAAEAMWMIFAPDSKALQALWFDRAFEAERAAEKKERREAKLSQLAPDARARLMSLCAQKERIEHLAKENPSLAVDLLASELEKLDALAEDFADLALRVTRAEQHASTFDFGAMNRSWHIFESQAKAFPPGDPRRSVAEQNLDVIRRRRARFEDLGRTLQVTRGQMELIEQTFRLLADEIVSMASPLELGGRIDELRVAVDAVRETADEDAFVTMEEEEASSHEGYR